MNYHQFSKHDQIFSLQQVQGQVVEEQHIEQPDWQRALEEELHCYLYPEVAKQPAVVPNEQEDGCNCVGQQVGVQQKDHHY